MHGIYCVAAVTFTVTIWVEVQGGFLSLGEVRNNFGLEGREADSNYFG
jgi:hypothetical protein